MNSEYSTPESPVMNAQMYYYVPGRIKTSSKVMRLITMGLQVVSILAYYLPSLLSGGEVGIVWLAIGVAQTIAFSVVFFRNERTRTAISITLMVLGTFVNLAMLIFISFYTLIGFQLGLYFGVAYLYSLCSLIALIFALCFPVRYEWIAVPYP